MVHTKNISTTTSFKFINHLSITYLNVYIENHIQNQIPFNTYEGAKNNSFLIMTPNANSLTNLMIT
jgi:hypothetical protein